MVTFLKKYFVFLTLSFLILGLSFIAFLIHHQHLDTFTSSVERIKQSGHLRLITSKSFNTYYLYEGNPMGFEYDLAKAFADYLAVELDIQTKHRFQLLV